MPDSLFSDPRLAVLYDDFDGARDDLGLYERIVRELGARSVLDIGCGTGSLACRLTRAGLDVVGVDPAEASLDVARSKPGADQVTWIHGDATVLPPMHVDVAVMTGNVAQVFLTDQDLSSTLRGIHAALRPGGHLVFESRRPEYQAWTEWEQDSAETAAVVDRVGTVTLRRDVTAIDLPLVSFQQIYTFPDGMRIASDSTLRFRSQVEIECWLVEAGFLVLDVKDAPDGPGVSSSSSLGSQRDLHTSRHEQTSPAMLRCATSTVRAESNRLGVDDVPYSCACGPPSPFS